MKPKLMTFEQLVDHASREIHSALLEGGGLKMKEELHFWMQQAILWTELKSASKLENVIQKIGDSRPR